MVSYKLKFRKNIETQFNILGVSEAFKMRLDEAYRWSLFVQVGTKETNLSADKKLEVALLELPETNCSVMEHAGFGNVHSLVPALQGMTHRNVC